MILSEVDFVQNRALRLLALFEVLGAAAASAQAEGLGEYLNAIAALGAGIVAEVVEYAQAQAAPETARSALGSRR